MESANEQPPQFQPAKFVDLVSIDASKIVKVSLYPKLAEITRVYTLSVKTGLNQLNILGLPDALDEQSVRVEGHGPATIHEVTVTKVPPEPTPTTSEVLDALLEKQEATNRARDRANKALSSLERYLTTINSQANKPSELKDTMSEYNDTAALWDTTVYKLGKELQQLEKEIKEEKERLAGPKTNEKLGVQASIGLFANSEDELEIILSYAVTDAGWLAAYDIHADMDSKEPPITLTYKAIITQNTGEEWKDIPLTLETSNPSFGIGVPDLKPWYLSFRERPGSGMMKHNKGVGSSMFQSRSRSTLAFAASTDFSMGAPGGVPSPLQERELTVSSKGNINATFTVPGIVTIPSDGASHSFTIVKLSLDAGMSWVSVPKHDARVHLNAKIHNSSEYTFLPGTGSIYVDGSFVARSDVPAVSPQESFDCGLGLDPSIKITYHPLSKKRTESGFYSKTANYTFVQRIQVYNTKTTAISHVKIIDQVPVSENSDIDVKLVVPALKVSNGATTKGTPVSLFPAIKQGDGVTVQWEGLDDPDCDIDAVGKDGKLNWVASIPPQKKINLALQWEVSFPAKEKLMGL